MESLLFGCATILEVLILLELKKHLMEQMLKCYHTNSNVAIPAIRSLDLYGTATEQTKYFRCQSCVNLIQTNTKYN